jgi:hypothetical protein
VLRRFRPHLTYANVIATLCLFLLLGGGTFAIAASDAKMDKKIANRVVTKRAPGLAVARATKATNLAAPEPFHEVGASGEPGFQHSWGNSGGPNETAAFYKDREGVVHLKGGVTGGATDTTIFQLPAGYRPASGKELDFAVFCNCQADDPQGSTVAIGTGLVSIAGPGLGSPPAGAVTLDTTGGAANLDGITFRAGS